MARRKADSENWGGARRGSGRAKLSKAERTTPKQISLPPRHWKWIEQQIDDDRPGFSAVIRALIESQID